MDPLNKLIRTSFMPMEIYMEAYDWLLGKVRLPYVQRVKRNKCLEAEWCFDLDHRKDDTSFFLNRKDYISYNYTLVKSDWGLNHIR